MKDECIKLAFKALKSYLASDEKISLPQNISKELKEKKSGVFVSLHKGNQLRGCIGTYLPTCDCLGEEIIENAIASCRDPRFMPVTADELPDLKIKVDVLSPPEKTSEEKLDPKRYGVIVKSHDGRTGLLLPDLEGVNSSETQLNIAKRKAGIRPSELVQIYRFTVKRHEE